MHPLGSLQRSPRPPSWNKRDLLLKEREGSRDRRGEGGKGMESTPVCILE